MKDKYRAAFFQLGGQIPSGFTAAVIFPPLGKKKNNHKPNQNPKPNNQKNTQPLNAAVAILH